MYISLKSTVNINFIQSLMSAKNHDIKVEILNTDLNGNEEWHYSYLSKYSTIYSHIKPWIMKWIEKCNINQSGVSLKGTTN